MPKKVSVIIPTYNREKELIQSIKTVFDQKYDGNIEIVAATKEGGLKVYGLKGDRWEELRVSGLPDKGLYRIYGLYCLDLNKDGKQDIAVVHSNANENSGGIHVFLTESNTK